MGGWMNGWMDGLMHGEEWTNGSKDGREPTICHGIQDGHAASVPSLANTENGSLPGDHLPHHNGKAEDITAVRVISPWDKVVSDTHTLISFPDLSQPGWNGKYDLTDSLQWICHDK